MKGVFSLMIAKYSDLHILIWKKKKKASTITRIISIHLVEIKACLGSRNVESYSEKPQNILQQAV